MNNFKNAIVYEIHPQSFKDSNNDGIGDLQGIIEKLDYLTLLGVNYLWLNPIYFSPQKDNGYDVSDYYQINPIFGTMSDFEELIVCAQKHGIALMMDMIFNHCSIEHPWFQKALLGDQKDLERFIFLEGNLEKPPTNWKSKFGGSAWEYNKKLELYYLHLFDKSQADLNWANSELRTEIYQIVKFWLEKGVKGLRFDVINLIAKPTTWIDDLLGDGRTFYSDNIFSHQYIVEMGVQSYHLYPNIITVGELSSTTIANASWYTNPAKKELDMAFTFHHLKVDYKDNNKWELEQYDPAKLIEIIRDWQLGVQQNNGWLANFLNNHDQPRALSRFGNPTKYRFSSATSLGAVTLMLRGTPFIYQGEEIGMENNNYYELKQFRDVESINYFHILKKMNKSEDEIFQILSARSRDNARTPMQWSPKPFAGFSEKTPWIDLNPNYKTINFENDFNSENSIFKAYQKLIALRKEKEALNFGEIIFIKLNPNVLSFYRIFEKEKIVIIINLSEEVIENDFNFQGTEILFNNYPDVTKRLKPFQTIIAEMK